LSIWLVQKFGAIGVAIGTLVGAVVSLGVHLFVSMHYTRSAVLIRRPRFVIEGLLRPLITITPSLLLYPFWRQGNILPASPIVLAIWMVATVTIAWTIGLKAEEHRELKTLFLRLVYFGKVRAEAE
jgi:hypothetical protein